MQGVCSSYIYKMDPLPLKKSGGVPEHKIYCDWSFTLPTQDSPMHFFGFAIIFFAVKKDL